MRTAIVIALVPLASGLSAPAQADWMRVLSGPVTRVAAAGHHAAAIRKQEVLIVREDGRVVSRMGNAELVAGQSETPALEDTAERIPAAERVLAAERILDRLEIPEIDRGTDDTDDLIEEESRLGERRFWRASRRAAASSHVVSTTALSASAHAIWIAADRGIFRVGEAGTITPIFGRQWVGARIAAADGGIVVDKGASLALLSTTDAEPHFIELPSPTSAPISHLAISASGSRIAWTATSVIHLVSAAGDATMDAADDILHLAFCGETLIVLLAHGALAIPPQGRAQMRAAPARARKLICPPGPDMPWVAIGEGLWVSSDQSQQWTALSTPKGAALVDAAVSDRHVWVATTAGLYLSVDVSVAAETSTESQPAPRARGHASASWLAWLMPKVSIRAAATFAPTGRRLEGFAFAAFPLGSHSIGVAAVNMPEDSPPAVEPSRMAHVSDVRDADALCLPLARRKAIELAMTEPERARSYVARAGRAAWLPELRVLLSRRYGRSESLDVNGSSAALSSPLGIDTVNDIRYEARATWDLGRLVFSSEELAAQAQALHMAELRRDIETTMNRLYFERRRLIVASARDSSVRTKEIEAELDAMSAGGFGACVSDKSIGAR